LSQSFDNTELLIRLGLTLSEAKVFVTLSELGMATAKTISKISDVPREFTYRILPELHNKGLIEEIVASPKMFRAIPIKNAYQNLLRDKEKENLELQTKIETACKIIPRIGLQNFEDPQIIMVPSGEATRIRIEREHKNAQNSIDTIVPWKKFPIWPS